MDYISHTALGLPLGYLQPAYSRYGDIFDTNKLIL